MGAPVTCAGRWWEGTGSSLGTQQKEPMCFLGGGVGVVSGFPGPAQT